MRDSMCASVPRVRAAWPLVELPSTRYPAASRAVEAASSAVVLPDPATPTTTVAAPDAWQSWPTTRR